MRCAYRGSNSDADLPTRESGVFDRYRIVAERDLAEGLAKLAESTSESPPATTPLPPKVSALRGK